MKKALLAILRKNILCRGKLRLPLELLRRLRVIEPVLSDSKWRSISARKSKYLRSYIFAQVLCALIITICIDMPPTAMHYRQYNGARTML